jgi:hypothetical protein
MADMQASASKSASDAAQTLSDQLLDSWSDSRKIIPPNNSWLYTEKLETEIKEWADTNGIRVPQGSKRNELLAIARKHRAQLTGSNAADSAKSAFGAATSSAGNQYAKATDDAQLKAEDAFNAAVGTWSEVTICTPSSV